MTSVSLVSIEGLGALELTGHSSNLFPEIHVHSDFVRRKSLGIISSQTLINDDGSCPVDAASATTVTNSPSHSFDAGDRMFLAGAGIATNYVYDDLGNTTTLPSIDTTNAAGDATLAYQPDSQVKSISQAGTVKTFTQDPLGRNVATVETATGSPTVTTVNYFDDSSDSPAWSVDSGLKWTRNISDLAGGLSVISSGTASSTAATSNKTVTSSSVQLTDMHGDAVATMETTAGANTPTSTSAFDEYGAVLSAPTTIPATYGWLGSQQRATTNAGLSLMGVRLYNPTTGRFLQTDPVPGGSPNTYAYPTDPIMGFDLDGKSWWKKIKKFLREHRSLLHTGVSLGVAALGFSLALASCTLAAAICMMLVSGGASVVMGAVGHILVDVGIGHKIKPRDIAKFAFQDLEYGLRGEYNAAEVLSNYGMTRGAYLLRRARWHG